MKTLPRPFRCALRSAEMVVVVLSPEPHSPLAEGCSLDGDSSRWRPFARMHACTGMGTILSSSHRACINHVVYFAGEHMNTSRHLKTLKKKKTSIRGRWRGCSNSGGSNPQQWCRTYLRCRYRASEAAVTSFRLTVATSTCPWSVLLPTRAAVAVSGGPSTVGSPSKQTFL